MVTIKTYAKYFYIKKYLSLFLELYPKKTVKILKKELKILVKTNNYKLLVAFKDKSPIGIAGITNGFLLYCHSYTQISNLYVKKQYRNLGIAKTLINHAESHAKKQKHEYLVLDSYLTNKDAQQIYQKEKFQPKAYHFMKEVS